MPIDFPNSPTNGDTYTVDSKTWSFNGTSWVLLQSDALLGNGSVTESKIADGAVTSAKIANGAVTAGKIASNAVSQAKLASNVSAVTITTSTNLATDVPSPFTGQMILETDTVKMKVWNGSSWVTITVAPPAAPTSLSAVPSTTSVAISFTPGSDNGAYITNHEYAVSTNGGSSYGAWTALSPADATSPVTVSGLTQGTAYYVKLRAVNATGPGTESSAVSFTTLATPNAPTGLTVSTSNATSIVISFTAPTNDGGAAITNYEYSIDAGSTWTALSPADAATPVTVTGLSSNTSYTIYLRAVNVAGSGTSSSGLSATTIPGAPTSLSTQSTTTTTAVIGFVAPTGSATITNYEFSTNGSTWTALSPADATSPVTVTGLSSNTANTIYLRAVNSAGSGTASSGVSATTLAGAPTGLSTTSTTTTTATISFTPPTGSATITNYEFSTNGSTWTALSPADATSPVTVTGLTANTAYTIYLRAVNSAGSGTASSGVAATTSLPSPTSINFLVLAGGGPGGNGAQGAIEASGGGAGGYRTSVGTSGGGAAAESPVSVSAGSSYTVTVGAGGAGTTGSPSNGSNSVFATITSLGGGHGGGNIPKNPNSGGSGGGGAKNDFGGNAIGGAGTAGQGYAGGNAAGQTAGGGGAGAAGGAGSSTVGGSGGAGVSSSITVTAVTRGGGGGGASGYGNWGAGGAGGGGSAPQNPGAPNTGGGGGGAQSTGSPAGGNGGSGIVILRYADSLADLTSISAGLTYTRTVTGGFKIYSFTAGTGTITV